ncbi:MAG: Protein of unknown function (DUF2582) [Phormidesmis priestleyi Ana]|uniref:Uncharacterized protein n=1 Tax=Phormidesmis priestleyi Ana TaxID=1666911 RepID=A0A0P8C0E8_9CYAN|nr:MAG: Protein of unknown function (DUF2582) [Phormidesmis priestleyi Ana]
MKGAISTNPATETFGQARQGSVAAIIQVLNEQLSTLGIRTRAVVADGMLQLLCEAASPEQLTKDTVVERVRTELETISPQRIKKVKINSRIVREDQLLWLEEINRDPENALLWSEVITLKRPFFVKRWIRDRHLKPAGPIFKDISEPEPTSSSLISKIIGGSSLALLLLAAGWLFRDDLSQIRSAEQPANQPTEQLADLPADPNTVDTEKVSTAAISPDERTADTTPPAASPSTTSNLPRSSTTSAPPAPATQPAANTLLPAANTGTTDAAGNAGNVADAFAEAVRIAEQAAIDGQTATTAAEWLDLAARWQKASDLMSNIPSGNEQYATAQNRIAKYQANSQAALQKATAAQAQ